MAVGYAGSRLGNGGRGRVDNSPFAAGRGPEEAAPSLLWVLAAGRLIGVAGAYVALTFFTIYLRTDLHLALAAVGAIAALLSVGAVAGGFLAGYAADRFGRRPALLLNLGLEVATLAALSLAHGTALVAALGFALGMADGGLWPTFGAALADLLPPERRQAGFAILGAAVNAGAAIGPAAGGLLLPFGFGPLFGTAAVGVGLCLLALALRLPETRPVPLEEGVGAAAKGGERAVGSGYGVLLHDGPVLAFFAVLFFPLVCMGLLATFFPLEAATTAGVGPERFGLIYALWGVLIALFQIPVTRALRRVRPVSAIAAGYGAMALGFLPIALWPGLWGFLLAFVILAFGSILAAPSTGSLVANLAPVEARARYQSMIGFDWSLGGIVAPLAAGVAYGRIGHGLFWLGAAVLALAPAPLLPIWRRRHARVRLAERLAMAPTGRGPGPAAAPAPAKP